MSIASTLVEGIKAGFAFKADVPVRVRPSQVGICVQRGRVANSTFLLETNYELLIALASAKVTAVQVIFATGYSATAVSVNANGAVRPVPNASDAASQAASGSHKQIRIAGATPFALAVAPQITAGGAGRALLTISDWIPVRSVARDDGGSGSLFVIRTHLTAGQVVISGNGTDSFAAWETQPDGRIMRRRHNVVAGDLTSTGTWNSWTTAAGASSSGCPIVGLRYIADGAVINMFGFGDSITEGEGTRIGEGWGLPAAVALSTNTGNVAVEWSNFAWAGQSMDRVRQHIVDTFAAGLLPEIAVIPSMSPNNIGNRSIVVADIDGAAGAPDAVDCAIMTRAKIHTALNTQSKPITPIWWTWLPTNSTVNNYGASDSLRRADNDSVRGWASHGVIVADFGAKLAGVTTGGQVQMLAGSTNDDIHPNDGGNALLAPVMTKAARKATGLVTPGLLAT